MKYSKELHERVRQNLRMFDYPRFDDGDIDALLDEIERLQAERRWIPVSERLPETNSDYITFGRWGGVMTGFYIVDSPYHWNVQEVTHWMPLPPPPEEE